MTRILKSGEAHIIILCEVFSLDREEIEFSNPDIVDKAAKIISTKYLDTQKLFETDLADRLKDYPTILDKYKKLKPIDIVKNVTEEFKKKIEKMTKLQEEYRKVNQWILENNIQIKALENRNNTREIMASDLAISLAIITKINEKADIKKLIEQLADKIEVNAEDVYQKIFPEDNSFRFQHIESGQFLSSINNEEITHPSGSQKMAISMGIILSLGETFGLPILLDEAFDRIDVKRLRFFSEFISGITKNPQSPQICLAGFTSFNIEKNPDVMYFVRDWRSYSVKRTKTLEKNVELMKEFNYN